MKDEVLAFCLAHGISPTRFAQQAGLDHTVMSKWLRGKQEHISTYSEKVLRRFMDTGTPTQAGRGAYAHGRRPGRE